MGLAPIWLASHVVGKRMGASPIPTEELPSRTVPVPLDGHGEKRPSFYVCNRISSLPSLDQHNLYNKGSLCRRYRLHNRGLV